MTSLRALLIVALFLTGCKGGERAYEITSHRTVEAKNVERDGPFGFAYGMTPNEVISTVGQDAVLEKSPGPPYGLSLKTAPSPNRTFSSYALVFSEASGLLAVMAEGAEVESSSSARVILTKFHELHTQLQSKYGKSTDLPFPRFIEGDLSGLSQEFLMVVVNGKLVESDWEFSGRKDHLKGIRLRVKGTGPDSGHVVLWYQYEGLQEYLKQIKASEAEHL